MLDYGWSKIPSTKYIFNSDFLFPYKYFKMTNKNAYVNSSIGAVDNINQLVHEPLYTSLLWVSCSSLIIDYEWYQKSKYFAVQNVSNASFRSLCLLHLFECEIWWLFGIQSNCNLSGGWRIDSGNHREDGTTTWRRVRIHP